jgi:hypothetical protein
MSIRSVGIKRNYAVRVCSDKSATSHRNTRFSLGIITMILIGNIQKDRIGDIRKKNSRK